MFAARDIEARSTMRQRLITENLSIITTYSSKLHIKKENVLKRQFGMQQDQERKQASTPRQTYCTGRRGTLGCNAGGGGRKQGGDNSLKWHDSQEEPVDE